MDAKATHFHLDTKGWGANYEVDIPFPENTSVILHEGAEVYVMPEVLDAVKEFLKKIVIVWDPNLH